MKKMKFLLPKILGLTLIAGVATILLAAIFKVLLLVSIVGLIIRFGANKFLRRKQMQEQYGMYGEQQFRSLQNGPEMFNGRSPFYNNKIVPDGRQQRSSGIIPIN